MNNSISWSRVSLEISKQHSRALQLVWPLKNLQALCKDSCAILAFATHACAAFCLSPFLAGSRQAPRGPLFVAQYISGRTTVPMRPSCRTHDAYTHIDAFRYHFCRENGKNWSRPSRYQAGGLSEFLLRRRSTFSGTANNAARQVYGRYRSSIPILLYNIVLRGEFHGDSLPPYFFLSFRVQFRDTARAFVCTVRGGLLSRGNRPTVIYVITRHAKFTPEHLTRSDFTRFYAPRLSHERRRDTDFRGGQYLHAGWMSQLETHGPTLHDLLYWRTRVCNVCMRPA